MQTVFTIGDLAGEFGVTLRTLRFYEDKDLLHPRREGQNRLYSRRDRARLKLILLGRRVGFSLNEIKEMVGSYELGDGSPPRLKTALRSFGTQVETLKRRKADVEQAIEELTHTMSIVAGMLRARETTLSDTVLEAAE
jgi:DNA-binding transcriptional MerR regulator